MISKSIIISVLAISLAGTVLITGCSRLGGASSQKRPISACQAELSGIPGMEPLLKPRSRDEETGDIGSLEGMQMALTINGAFTGKVTAEDAEDDWCYTKDPEQQLNRLLDALSKAAMPPTVSFVSARYLDQRLIERWLQSGNFLGSLTYNRLKSRRNSPGQFIEDLARNEEAFAPLLKKFPQKAKYFRYPRLKASSDPHERQQITEYLKANSFIEVPATIDPRDLKFGQIYCASQARGDQSCANYVKQSFFTLLLDTAQKARETARNTTGRDCKHVLMLEATRFTSENLAEIIGWFKRLGVQFIKLDEALTDPLYTDQASDGESRAVEVFRTVRTLQSDGDTR